MYIDFFKLKHKPFKLTPDPDVFHENSRQFVVYKSLLDGLLGGKRLILLSGDTGTGKTLCVQRLVNDLESEPGYRPVIIPYLSLPFDEMLGLICSELNLNYGLDHDDDKLEILERFLEHGVSPIRSIVVIIDEAQNLASGIFDDLTALLALGERTKRDIQLVIIARSESDLNLNHPHMAAFRGRIELHCHLEPLSPKETASYIRYRLQAAGAAYTDLFTEEAAQKVYELTQGRARSINILCDLTLDIAAAEREPIITVAHVEKAYHQQRFDDTVEIQTSQISEAIAQFVNEQGKETEPSFLPEPETVEHIKPEKVDTVEESLPRISDPEDQEVSFKDHEVPGTAGPRLKLDNTLETKASGKSLWGKTIGLLVVLAIIGFVYLQYTGQPLWQKKGTTAERPQVMASTGDGKVVHLPEQEVAEQVVSTKEDPETAANTHDAGGEPQPTIYLTDQEEQLAALEASEVKISKQPLNEDNGVVYTIEKSADIESGAESDTATKAEIAQFNSVQVKKTEDAAVEVEQLFSIAESQIDELKLTEPVGDNALETYHQILAIEPGNEQAREEILKIKSMFLTWANNNLESNRLTRARHYFQKALIVDPEDSDIPQQLARLDRLIEEQKDHIIKAGLLELSKEGNVDDIQILLEKGAYPDVRDQRGNTPLMVASDRGFIKIVKTLLKHGADPNLKNNAGDTALINAVWNNHTAIAGLLIRSKAHINTANKRGWTPLMYAALHGHYELFRLLLKNGANMEARTKDGKTALSIAAHNGKRKIVSLLLQNGASPHTTDTDGWTPLMHAVWNNHATVVQILLLKGALVNQQNVEGWTSLMMAAWNGYEPIVKMLLQNGADKSLVNKEGNTAFELASEQKHYSIVAHLR